MKQGIPILLLAALMLAWCMLPSALHAQQACEPPSKIPSVPGAERITPQQEADIGDIIAEQFQRNYRVIEDEELTAYLNRMGGRILQQIPGAHPSIQFFLVDLPFANAFSLPGHVYVTRMMIAFVHDEDELAGLMGHEMGHILSHQISRKSKIKKTPICSKNWMPPAASFWGSCRWTPAGDLSVSWRSRRTETGC